MSPHFFVVLYFGDGGERNDCRLLWNWPKCFLPHSGSSRTDWRAMGKTGSGWWIAGQHAGNRQPTKVFTWTMNWTRLATWNRLSLLRRLRSFRGQGTVLRPSYESVVASGIFYGAVCWACISAQTQNQTGDDLSRPAPWTQWWRWETGQCRPSWRPCCITPLTSSKALIAGATSVIDRRLHLCCTKGKVPLSLPASITTSDRLGSLILCLCHSRPINFWF